MRQRAWAMRTKRRGPGSPAPSWASDYLVGCGSPVGHSISRRSATRGVRGPGTPAVRCPNPQLGQARTLGASASLPPRDVAPSPSGQLSSDRQQILGLRGSCRGQPLAGTATAFWRRQRRLGILGPDLSFGLHRHDILRLALLQLLAKVVGVTVEGIGHQRARAARPNPTSDPTARRPVPVCNGRSSREAI